MGKIDLRYGDLLDQHSLEIVMAEVKPDEVYNFAAYDLLSITLEVGES